MIRSLLYLVAILTVLINFTRISYSLDFTTLADQDSYRCSESVVAIGDLDRTVREKCGDPLKIGSRQDWGPIWIYHSPQAEFMYYLCPELNNHASIVGNALFRSHSDKYTLF